MVMGQFRPFYHAQAVSVKSTPEALAPTVLSGPEEMGWNQALPLIPVI